MRGGLKTVVVRLFTGRSTARFLTGLLITLGTGLMLGRVPPPDPAIPSSVGPTAGIAVELPRAIYAPGAGDPLTGPGAQARAR
jgi:hypothetical protein